jgi:hypothetical protein
MTFIVIIHFNNANYYSADPQGGQPQMIDYHNPQQDVMYLPNGQQGHAPMQQFPGGASNAALQQHMLQQQLQYQLQIQQMMLVSIVAKMIQYHYTEAYA